MGHRDLTTHLQSGSHGDKQNPIVILLIHIMGTSNWFGQSDSKIDLLRLTKIGHPQPATLEVFENFGRYLSFYTIDDIVLQSKNLGIQGWLPDELETDSDE
jgi:hypothetical protein